ncbi:hypothetical protein ACKKBG_A14305 [Auxenochlorella protothecoides x Auxenochlorella symbiontica]
MPWRLLSRSILLSLGPPRRPYTPPPPCRAPLRPAHQPFHTRSFSSIPDRLAPPSLPPAMAYLSKADAAAIDAELMGPGGFSLDQLMELAGLSVACSLAAEYPTATHPRVLVLAGPGNNGGDGLVAARHLRHFGYEVAVAYPRPTQRPPFQGLVTQLRRAGARLVPVEDLGPDAHAWPADVVLDGLFGFSFRGPLRPPFDALVAALAAGAGAAARATGAGDAVLRPCPALVSIDVPSGWDVEAGDEAGDGLRPDMLVSLTAPKRCAARFAGAHHYLGGRFLTPDLAARYGLADLPPFPGTQQCLRLGGAAAAATSGGLSGSAHGGGTAGSAPAPAPAPPTTAPPHDDLPGMRQSYTAGTLEESDAPADPLALFQRWFGDARAHPGVAEPNAMVLSTLGAGSAPSARVVLLKGLDSRGFAFFTNYASRKGTELDANPAAALTFFWEPLQRQVRVEGLARRLPAAESEAYFNSRPRGSQLGAWASRQSAPVAGNGRAALDERMAELEGQYADEREPVPYPEHWGGFVLEPHALEFWQGRPSRLHDRLVYKRRGGEEGGWTLTRLQP